MLDEITKFGIELRVQLERREAMKLFLQEAACEAMRSGDEKEKKRICCFLEYVHRNDLDRVEERILSLGTHDPFYERLSMQLGLLFTSTVSYRRGLQLHAEQQIEFAQLQQGSA
jgi:hypothetical protein